MLRACIAILAIALSAGCAVRGSNADSEISTSRNLADVLEILRPSYAGRTLLVLDIDDTLLTSAGFFGSDAWYEWQRRLSPGSPGYVPCRFDVMAMHFETGAQLATQPEAVEIINSIRIDKIILTSRSDLSRGGTVRELKRAGYILPKPLRQQGDAAVYDWQRDASTPPATVGRTRGCCSWICCGDWVFPIGA
jgi:hypothetical protein